MIMKFVNSSIKVAPYWNVNDKSPKLKKEPSNIKVAPYWNVNQQD